MRPPRCIDSDFFASGLTRFPTLEETIDDRFDRFTIHATLHILVVHVHECIFLVSSSPILFEYLHTQAAGSHERSMVRASGARSEPFLLCPSS